MSTFTSVCHNVNKIPIKDYVDFHSTTREKLLSPDRALYSIASVAVSQKYFRKNTNDALFLALQRFFITRCQRGYVIRTSLF